MISGFVDVLVSYICVLFSSQGVYIGGLQSSFGVLGAWTTIFHDEDDPVGAFTRF